jgi:hypothetical protein
MYTFGSFVSNHMAVAMWVYFKVIYSIIQLCVYIKVLWFNLKLDTVVAPVFHFLLVISLVI